VRYSFPSKLIEYMASATPVLTTRLPGIPPEYEPYVYWIEDDSVEGIEHSLRAVMCVGAGRTNVRRRDELLRSLGPRPAPAASKVPAFATF